MAANLETAFNITCLVERRNKNNRNRLIFVVALQLQRQLETRDLLHHNIHENQVGRFFGHVRPEIDQVVRNDNCEFGLQQRLNIEALDF
jgi:hypothetical protein